MIKSQPWTGDGRRNGDGGEGDKVAMVISGWAEVKNALVDLQRVRPAICTGVLRANGLSWTRSA